MLKSLPVIIGLALGFFLRDFLHTQKAFEPMATLEELVMIDPHSVSSSVIVKDYRDVGDGGGGVFWYEASSRARTNAGLVFKPVAYEGRWIRQRSGPINVKWFGARTDGTDTAADLQSAIDYAESTGMPIYVPGGVYQIESTLKIGYVRGLSMFGDHYESSIISVSDTSKLHSIINIGGTNNQSVGHEFRNIHFQGRNKTFNGIYAPRLSHALFWRVRISGASENALNIGYGWCNDVLECELDHNPGNGLKLNADHDFANNAVNIENTKIFNNGLFAVVIVGGKSVNISGCTLEGNGAGAINAFNVVGLSVRNCYFEGNAKDGFRYEDPDLVLRSEITLNGDNQRRFSGAYPVINCIIEQCSVIGGYSTNFVTGIAVVNCRIEGNFNDRRFAALNVIRAVENSRFGKTSGIIVNRNYGFAADVVPWLLEESGNE